MKKILLIAIFIYVAQSSFAQIQTQIKPPDQENTDSISKAPEVFTIWWKLCLHGKAVKRKNLY